MIIINASILEKNVEFTIVTIVTGFCSSMSKPFLLHQLQLLDDPVTQTILFSLVDQRNERSLINDCSIVFFPRYIKSVPSNMWIRIKYTHYIINLKRNLLYIISIYMEGYAFLSFISWFLVIPSESQLFLQALCDKEALLAP